MDPQVICEKCNIIVKNPQYFSCGHLVCPKELSNIIKFNHILQPSSTSALQFTCECELGNVEFSLEQLHDILSNLNILFCITHNALAKSYCTNCEKQLCEKCIEIHNEIKLDHVISNNNDSHEVKTCSIHQNVLKKHYCNVCNEMICYICISEDTKHAFHSIQSVEDYAEKGEIPQNQRYSEIMTKVGHFDKIISNFNEKFNDQQVKTISKFDKIIETLKQYKDIYRNKMQLISERNELFFKVIKMIYVNSSFFLNPLVSDLDEKIEVKLNDSFEIKKHYHEELEKIFEKIEANTDSLNILNKPIQLIFQGVNQEFSNNSIQTKECNASVFSLLQLKDGRLASTASDNAITIWTVSKSGLENGMVLTGHTDWVWSLIQLTDGRLVSASSDATIKFWVVGQKEFTNTISLTGHNSAVRSLIKINDELMVSGSNDKTVKFWKMENYHSWTCTQTLTGHSSVVTALLKLDNGRIASGSGDGSIIIWNENDQQLFQKQMTGMGHQDMITALIKFKDGRIASGSADKTIHIWEIRNEAFAIVLSFSNYCGVCSFLQIKDQRLVVGSSDHTIKFWDITENYYKNTLTLRAHSNLVKALVQLTDGRIVSASYDGTIKVWG